MAFKDSLEKALEKIADPTYRDQMRTLLERDPVFAAGYLAQDEFDRSFNAHKEEKAVWKKWYDDNLLAFNQGKENVAAANAEKNTAIAQAQEAANKLHDLELKFAAGEGTAAEESALLKEIQTLKGSMTAMEANLGVKFVDNKGLETKAQEMTSYLGNQFFNYQDIRDKHIETFGKPFTVQDRKDLLVYMEEQRIRDMSEAYDKKFGTQTTEAWREAERKKIREEVTKEIHTNAGVPNAAGSAPMGAVEAMMRGQAPEGLKPGATMQEAALAASASLRNEGKY